MNTTNSKTLSEMVKDVLENETLSKQKKAEALIKLGLTKHEATCLANTVLPTRSRFTYTFGVEMETVNCRRYMFYQEARARGIQVYDNFNYNHTDMAVYKLVPDASLSGQNTAECVTPALKGERSGFDSLKACCEALVAIGATTNRSCGLHVHIGAADLTDQEYANVFLNYQRLERAIDSFMAESRRGNSSQWARTLTNHNLEYCRNRNGVYNELGGDRYHKVNPCSWARHKTIEFRQHQGTVNYTKIAAWVTFLGKLVEYSKTHRLGLPINRIEDIPFLSESEKAYFIGRRNALRG